MSVPAAAQPSAESPRANRLLSWISGEVDDEPRPSANDRSGRGPEPADPRRPSRDAAPAAGRRGHRRQRDRARSVEPRAGRDGRHRGGRRRAEASPVAQARPPRRRRPTEAPRPSSRRPSNRPGPCRTPLPTPRSARRAEPRILRRVPERLPAPGPSFLREHELRVRDAPLWAGMSRPSTTRRRLVAGAALGPDDDGVVSFRDLASVAGPPAGPPLLRLGPAIADALSGWIVEEDGRLAIRLNVVAPPDDPTRPWLAPAAVRAAFKFEPARAAATRPNELAEIVLTAFRRGVEGLARALIGPKCANSGRSAQNDAVESDGRRTQGRGQSPDRRVVTARVDQRPPGPPAGVFATRCAISSTNSWMSFDDARTARSLPPKAPVRAPDEPEAADTSRRRRRPLERGRSRVRDRGRRIHDRRRRRTPSRLRASRRRSRPVAGAAAAAGRRAPGRASGDPTMVAPAWPAWGAGSRSSSSASCLLLFILLAGSGLDLWTDAIWYRSVGYDAVFFTRLWAQVGLFVLGAVIGIVVPVRQPLAGRAPVAAAGPGWQVVGQRVLRSAEPGRRTRQRPRPVRRGMDRRARERARAAFGRSDDRPPRRVPWPHGRRCRRRVRDGLEFEDDCRT